MEQKCQNDHPRKPGECGAKNRAYATFGTFDIECWRCFGRITFNFDESGTESAGILAHVVLDEADGIRLGSVA